METSTTAQNGEGKDRKDYSGLIRVLLVLLIFLLFAGITWLNSHLYAGVYDSGIGNACLLFSVILLLTPARNARLRFPWVLAISLALTLLCGALFLVFRPGCTLAQAQRQLEEAGYTEVIPNPDYSRMAMVQDGNPMVSTGYVLQGVKDGESQVFFVNPVNGEWNPTG